MSATLIYPADLKDNHPALLAALFKQYADVPRFKKDEVYKIKYPDAEHEVEIQLANSILKRSRTKGKPGFRYEVQNEAKKFGPAKDRKTLGEGGYGRVYTILKTLKIEGDEVVYSKDKPLVMKKMLLSFLQGPVKKSSRDIKLTTLEKAEVEASFTHVLPHLKGKPLVFVTKGGKEVTYLVMKGIPGSLVQDIIDDDYTCTKILSTDERFQICLRLLETLQSQIHRYGIIHRDIKPRNVFFDFKTEEVNYIDVGLSMFAELSDKREMVGTPHFASPEVFKREGSTLKSDIYSLAKILILIWRGNIGEPGKTTADWYKNAKDVPINPIFIGIPNISEQVKNDLVKLFTDLTKEDSASRLTTDQAINRLKAIYQTYLKEKENIHVMKDEINRSISFYLNRNDIPEYASKLPFLQAIQDYITHTLTEENIKDSKHAASPRRSKDIRDLLDIILLTIDSDEMKTKLTDRVSKIQTSMGASLLRDKLLSAIENPENKLDSANTISL